MKRPGQPRPRVIEVCKRCGQPYVLLSVEGWCPHCKGDQGRSALEHGAAGRTAPVVDAGAARPRQDWLERPD